MKCYVLRKQKKYSDAISLLQNMISYIEQLHQKALTQKEKESRIVKINDNFSLIYNDSAIELYEQKEYKGALDLFQKSLSMKPDDYGITANIGDCYLVGRD